MSTWNPFTGCSFNCSYCWARKLAEGKLERNYPNGFIPEFHQERLKVSFKPGDFVFVCSMSDIAFCKTTDFALILERIRLHPLTDFLLLSKNPAAFRGCVKYPSNVVLGTTIESNRDYGLTKAPPPYQRFEALKDKVHPRKFVSIEPIMEFDLIEFSDWLYEINPEIIEIGADNYKNSLPEPSGDKVSKLIGNLMMHSINVIQKAGLERLN